MDSKKFTRAADHKFMPATMTDIFLENTLDVQGAARGRGSLIVVAGAPLRNSQYGCDWPKVVRIPDKKTGRLTL